MALRDQPYIPLYVQDYLTDEKLNLCSPSTQGVYIKIMCVFHKSEKYGGILLKQKDKQNKNICLDFALKLAKLLPFQLDIIIESLNELIDENVLSIDGDFLYQKRMVKDNDISTKRSESGKKGGEKSLGKDKNLLKQKTKQNPEDEYEYEYENKDVIKKNKKLSFITDASFIPIIEIWLKYKSDRKEKYKSDESLKQLYSKIYKLSSGNAELAKEIINQSMANNWAGIFKLKDDGQNFKKQPTASEQSDETRNYVMQFAEQAIRECEEKIR
jgi:hypothetical protein